MVHLAGAVLGHFFSSACVWRRQVGLHGREAGTSSCTPSNISHSPKSASQTLDPAQITCSSHVLLACAASAASARNLAVCKAALSAWQSAALTACTSCSFWTAAWLSWLLSRSSATCTVHV